MKGAAMSQENPQDLLRALADRQAVLDLMHATADLLDNEKLDEWLELFDEGAEYELGAYSPEIRRETSWWKVDRATLGKQLAEVRQHVRDPARRRHVLGLPLIDLNGDRARAVCAFSIFRTLPDGTSSLYVVGRYEDGFVKKAGRWLYASHKVVADTRVLDSFTHLPL
jgi:3-phenylpropionate/cinnamic acid dioxygenase small subunit